MSDPLAVILSFGEPTWDQPLHLSPADWAHGTERRGAWQRQICLQQLVWAMGYRYRCALHDVYSEASAR